MPILDAIANLPYILIHLTLNTNYCKLRLFSLRGTTKNKMTLQRININLKCWGNLFKNQIQVTIKVCQTSSKQIADSKVLINLKSYLL